MKSNKAIMTALIVVAVVCIGVALSYPIRYKMELDSNNTELEDLSSMRRRVMEEQHIGEEDEPEGVPEAPPEDQGGNAAPAQSESAEAPAEQPFRTPEAESAEVAMPQRDAPEPVQTDESGEAPQPVTEQTEQARNTPEPVTQQTGRADEPETAQTDQADEPEPTPPQPRILVDTPEPAPVQTEGNPEPTQAQTDGTEETAPPQPRILRDTPEPTQAQTGGNQEPATAQTDETTEPATAQTVEATPTPEPTPGLMELLLNNVIVPTDTPAASSTPVPVTPSPSPTPDRSARDDPDTYKAKAKIKLDESKILPELKEIYALNHHLVGWLYIEDTNIDYPVVQNKEDRTFYLTHDFYGKSNANGQIIMEDKCDPWTPSYNLVLSGHHMNSGAMFGKLGKYKDKAYWETHKIVEFDTLMARKRYVVFAAFYSADYNENEKGFRYSADIQYKLDADLWLGEIQANQIYETGIEAEFGDEFITLTTCDHSKRANGRFVVVARRIREGEKIQ